MVFIHPGESVGETDLSGLPPLLVDFPHDTTRTAASLIYSGTLERCPNLRLMLSHGGGTVPFIAWRLTFLEKDPSFRDNVPQGVMSYLRRLYLDTALCASRYALPPMRELVGVEHILFGTDYAFAPEPVTTATVRRLGEFNGFNSSERQRVERDNALTLFPRLRERLPAADGGGGRG